MPPSALLLFSAYDYRPLACCVFASSGLPLIFRRLPSLRPNAHTRTKPRCDAKTRLSVRREKDPDTKDCAGRRIALSQDRLRGVLRSPAIAFNPAFFPLLFPLCLSLTIFRGLDFAKVPQDDEQRKLRPMRATEDRTSFSRVSALRYLVSCSVCLLFCSWGSLPYAVGPAWTLYVRFSHCSADRSVPSTTR